MLYCVALCLCCVVLYPGLHHTLMSGFPRTGGTGAPKRGTCPQACSLGFQSCLLLSLDTLISGFPGTGGTGAPKRGTCPQACFLEFLYCHVLSYLLLSSLVLFSRVLSCLVRVCQRSDVSVCERRHRGTGGTGAPKRGAQPSRETRCFIRGFCGPRPSRETRCFIRVCVQRVIPVLQSTVSVQC